MAPFRGFFRLVKPYLLKPYLFSFLGFFFRFFFARKDSLVFLLARGRGWERRGGDGARSKDAGTDGGGGGKAGQGREVGVRRVSWERRGKGTGGEGGRCGKGGEGG